MAEIVLELASLSHGFGKHRVLHDVNLKIVRGQIVSLVGPSGCGKSTLLRAILGTHPPRQGAVIMNGTKVTRPGRDRGIVYQRYSLFPFLTALQNVAFGLMLDQTSLASRFFLLPKWRRLRKQHLDQSAALLDKLGLGAAVDRYPHQLSGGMNQRVAVAQALIMRPKILLLDEPFGALDEATREDLQGMLLELYQENLSAKRAGQNPPYTIIIVTHELNEAIYVADRILGLSRYWHWEQAGHRQSPGATIIYDKVAPVFHPDDRREYYQFVELRREIRECVFEPKQPLPRDANLRFWEQCRQGQGVGVMAP